METRDTDCPFTPGTGNEPPLLAGRDRETRLLGLMLKRLEGIHPEKPAKKARPPLAPIKIVGPRGVGKTVLLTWTERQAEANGEILVIRSAYLKDGDRSGDPMQSLVNAMKKWPAKVLETLKETGVSLPGGFGVNFKTDRPADTYEQLVESIVRARPLLLLLDEAHHFDLQPLSRLLQVNQQLISKGCPLGMVLAGTPGLDSHLSKAEATFIARSTHIDIHVLSDEATRAALRGPFEQEGVTVTPEALEAMAAQTDNYPYFIQLVGEAVWHELAAAGHEEVGLELVRRIEEQARKDRNRLYNIAWLRLYSSDLMPYAHRVIDLLDRNKGRVFEKDVFDLLHKESGGKKSSQVMPIYEALREDGLIWTEDGETKPGIPSFFNYCKERERTGDRSSRGGFPRSWLPDFLPGFFLPKKRG